MCGRAFRSLISFRLSPKTDDAIDKCCEFSFPPNDDLLVYRLFIQLHASTSVYLRFREISDDASLSAGGKCCEVKS